MAIAEILLEQIFQVVGIKGEGCGKRR
jgi:hypothetical protein